MSSGGDAGGDTGGGVDGGLSQSMSDTGGVPAAGPSTGTTSADAATDAVADAVANLGFEDSPSLVDATTSSGAPPGLTTALQIALALASLAAPPLASLALTPLSLSLRGESTPADIEAANAARAAGLATFGGPPGIGGGGAPGFVAGAPSGAAPRVGGSAAPSTAVARAAALQSGVSDAGAFQVAAAPLPVWRTDPGAASEVEQAFQTLYGRAPTTAEAQPYRSQLLGGSSDPAGIRNQLASTIKVPFTQAQDIVSGYWRDLFAVTAPSSAPGQAGLRESIALGQAQPSDVLGQLQPFAQEQVLGPLLASTATNLAAATGYAQPYAVAQSAGQQAVHQRPAIGSLDAVIARAQSLLGLAPSPSAGAPSPGTAAPAAQPGAAPGAAAGVRVSPSSVASPFFDVPPISPSGAAL